MTCEQKEDWLRVLELKSSEQALKDKRRLPIVREQRVKFLFKLGVDKVLSQVAAFATSPHNIGDGWISNRLTSFSRRNARRFFVAQERNELIMVDDLGHPLFGVGDNYFDDLPGIDGNLLFVRQVFNSPQSSLGLMTSTCHTSIDVANAVIAFLQAQDDDLIQIRMFEQQNLSLTAVSERFLPHFPVLHLATNQA